MSSDDTGAYDAKITGLPVSYDGAISTSTRVEVEETPVVLVKQLSVRSSEDEVAEGGQACLSACLSKPGVQVIWISGSALKSALPMMKVWFSPSLYVIRE